MTKTTLLTAFLASSLVFSGCSKQDAGKDTGLTSGKSKASASAQPEPGDRKNFTVVYGEFSETGGNPSCWVRLANWEFTSSTARIKSNFWNWDTNNDIQYTVMNPHACTMDGISKSCTIGSPTGWIVGGGVNPMQTWEGGYTYNTTTKELHITWDNGIQEKWTISNPQSDIARAVWTWASSGYSITHGRGYGSDAAWTVYKPVTQFPRINYNGGGKKVTHYYLNNNGTITNTITPSAPGTWTTDHVDFSAYTSASSGSPTLHWRITGSGSCNKPGYTHTGAVNHLGGNNTSRMMVYNLWQACLCPDSVWPCYTNTNPLGNLHPLAMMQIIGDNGAIYGLVGIEAQNRANTPNWEFMLRDITTIP